MLFAKRNLPAAETLELDADAVDPEPLTRRLFVGAALASAVGFFFCGPEEALAAKAKKDKAKQVKYRIVYKLDGGKNPKGQVKRIAKGKALPVGKLKKPKRKGYKFKCWCTNKKLTKKAKKVHGLKAKKRRTLYAKWSKVKYNITYTLNGGSFTTEPKKTYTIESKDRTLKTPKRRGYDFLGWYQNANLTGSRVTVLPHGSTGDKAYFAKWYPYTDWNRYMAVLLPTIKSRTSACASHGDSFIFITDVHWKANAQKSPALMKRVMDATGIKKVFCGGDLIVSHTSSKGRQYARESMGAWVKSMSFVDELYTMRGNHDSNDEEANDGKPENALSDKEYFETVFAQGSKARAAMCATGMMADYGTAASDDTAETARIDGDDEASKYVAGSYPLCYYVDNEKQKIRYICLDNGHPADHVMEPEQIAWLTEAVLSCEPGWGVFVMTHILFRPKTFVRSKSMVYIQTALDGIYDLCKYYKISIIGVMGGHIHLDHSIVSAKGYPLFTTGCDAYNRTEGWSAGSPANRPGTIEEQCFDVVHIDTSKRTITLSRVGGYGGDRVFGY